MAAGQSHGRIIDLHSRKGRHAMFDGFDEERAVAQAGSPGALKHIGKSRAWIVATFSSCSRIKRIPAPCSAGPNVSVACSPENKPAPTTDTSFAMVR